MEKLFEYTVELNNLKESSSKVVLSDTTVQENNITYPTDSKLLKKVIDKCNKIVKKEELPQRQSYVKVSKQLVRDSYNPTHPRRVKRAKASVKKLKTIASRLLRELDRNLQGSTRKKYYEDLLLFNRVVTQKRSDKEKVYSLHKPYTSCIAKGKSHKKYEFGNKVGLIVEPKSNVILAVESYAGNPHDSKTIAPLLEQMKRTHQDLPKEIVYDRAAKGIKEIQGVQILSPSKPKKTSTEYQKRSLRKKFRARAGIEPVIGHLKKYFRMEQNYYKAENSPKLNALLSATAWNMKKVMAKTAKSFLDFIYFYLNSTLSLKTLTH